MRGCATRKRKGPTLNGATGLDDGGTPIWSWIPDAVASETSEIDSCIVDPEWSFTAASSDSADTGIAAMSSLSSTTFTFRLPYGPYGDGTYGTLVDTPALNVGDEVILFLTYDEDGDHQLVPLHWMGASVFRVFRGSGGGTAIANGFGQPLFYAADGRPVVGAGRAALRQMYFADPPLDPDDVSAAILGLANAATWSGSGQAKGVWHSRLSVDVTGDADASCVADLHGMVNAAGTGLSLSGWCNANYAGRVDVTLAGTRSGTTWSGTITFTPAALPTESRQIPWTSDLMWNDLVLAEEADDYSEGGYDFEYSARLTAGFAGNRPLMTLGQFASFLSGLADDHAATAGVAYSLLPDSTTCDPDIDVVEVTP